MPPSRKIVLHIGWPKTGTTTLQQHVLPRLAGYRYLGKAPFSKGKNELVFQLVHLLAYASRERFEETHMALWDGLEAQERSLFGDVDASIPWIISDEGVLSALLKPSLHQHHGYSTASLEQIMERLLLLEQRWRVTFNILLVERDPAEVLHAYYAQMFHHFHKVPGLGNFRGYVSTGTNPRPMQDLGFRYLQPGYTLGRLRERIGANRIFSIPMAGLFQGGSIRLSHWYPPFPDVEASVIPVENRRSVAKGTKLAHLRPIWAPKQPFSLSGFLRQVKALYKVQHAPHSALEVHVRMKAADKEQLDAFMAAPSAEGNHPAGAAPAAASRPRGG